jgi:hypothetical protein
MPSQNVVNANALLASWLQEQHPEIFAELANRAGAAQLSGLWDSISSTVSSWGSAIGSAASSIGSTLSKAAGAVGSYISTDEGKSVLSTLVSTKIQVDASKKIVDAQIARANAGYSPLPIQTTYDPTTGAYVPTITNAQGQQIALTGQMLANATPGFLDRYGLWVVGGGAALILVALLLRGRN